MREIWGEYVHSKQPHKNTRGVNERSRSVDQLLDLRAMRRDIYSTKQVQINVHEQRFGWIRDGCGQESVTEINQSLLSTSLGEKSTGSYKKYEETKNLKMFKSDTQVWSKMQ